MKYLSRTVLFVAIACLLASAAACGTAGKGLEGGYIIDAREASKLISKQGVSIVDMQNAEDYKNGHVEAAVNIVRNDIVINEPVENMLAPKEQIEQVLGRNGISNNTTIIIYDNTNNMDAARMWWTLRIYGHEDVKVVSGGIKALKAAGAKMSTDSPRPAAVKYTAKDVDRNMIASIDEVTGQVDEPRNNVILLDTRTREEFDQGAIPGAVLLDFMDNNYKDGTYKSVQDIKIQYIEQKITPDKTVVMYCKTSVRAAQTYLALYNAGYRNLKLYDGAWLEWSADKSAPVQTPTGNKVESNQKDNS